MANKKISQITAEETVSLSDDDVFEGEQADGTSFQYAFSVLKSTLAALYAAITLTTHGDILYRDASGLQRLAAGLVGKFLHTGGVDASPSWQYSPYVLRGGQNVFNPADSTTYYFGRPFVNVGATTAAIRKIMVPRAGTVTRVDISVGNNTGTQGSNEVMTISLRLNNTTDTTLSSAFTINQVGGGSATFSVTGLTIAVAAEDYLEVKLVTPAWVTNPTNVVIEVDIYIS